MNIVIRDLAENDIDSFITQDSDIYAKVTHHDTTYAILDLTINVKSVMITKNMVSIRFPNDGILTVQIDSSHYHKIEVI